jgi:hypothetical protein
VKATLLAEKLEAEDKCPASLAPTIIVELATRLLADRVEVQNAENPVAGTMRAEEVEMVSAVCGTSQLAMLNLIGAMCWFHIRVCV